MDDFSISLDIIFLFNWLSGYFWMLDIIEAGLNCIPLHNVEVSFI